MYCEKCGSKVSDNASFCHKCGAKIIKVSEELNDKNNVVQEEPISKNNIQTTEQPNNSQEDSIFTTKNIAIAAIFIVAGYLFFPGLIYYNTVIWGTVWIAFSLVKKYWKTKSYIKIIATILAALTVMTVFNVLKNEHKKMVREKVMNDIMMKR